MSKDKKNAIYTMYMRLSFYSNEILLYELYKKNLTEN